MDLRLKKPVYVVRETINQRTYPIAWTHDRASAEQTIDKRVDELVKEHELDESKVFVNKSGNRTSIFKQCSGFFYNGNMVGQQTLSLVEVPHASALSDSKDDELTAEEVADLASSNFID